MKTMHSAMIVALATASVALATDFTWTNGDGDRAWTNPLNWDYDGQSPAYPSNQYDTATIPCINPGCNGDDQEDYPIFDSSEITIGSLTINASTNFHELTFAANQTTPRKLIIASRDGLTLNNGHADILLQENSRLQLDGGGVIDLRGAIVFDNAGSTPPRFILGDGTTLTVRHAKQNDDVTFQGVEKGLITGEVAAQNDRAETLVLASGAYIRGSFDIDVILLNNGEVHTAPDDGDPGVINLVCHPKAGSGHWYVDGGVGTGQGQESTLLVATGLNGTGRIAIDRFGWFIVERPAAFVHDGVSGDTGNMSIREGGTLRVKADIAFDVHLWTTDCLFPV
ncbi:MAG: hypothetical protein C4547_12850 [Phycisphaerales bacterium]|nr:MAG: hypothetical protein C4547_12850 [Phycisphaerales bacterium]